MVAFSRATAVQQLSSDSNDDPLKVYRGDVDSEWTVGAVPQGGYVLALVIESCLKRQSPTAHPDLIHVSAHFLHSASVGPFKVHVRSLKVGRGFSNIVANLIQNGRTMVTAHLIFGVLAASPADPGPRLTLAPPSPYARRLPLSNHPSTFSRVDTFMSSAGFSPYVKVAPDPAIREMNRPDSLTRTVSTTIGGGGLDWGGWVEFTGKEDKITTPSLALLSDIMVNTPKLLPGDELVSSWHPTMTLAIEFKFPIPSLSPDHSNQTVAVYSSGRFINDPQGRHDLAVEIWTSPSSIGHGGPSEGWREKQVCLAVATQMALTFSMEFNHQLGRPKL